MLEHAQKEALNIADTGMSIMEISHRSKTFISILQKAERDLRFLLSIPDNYSVLFMQGGATAQFAAIPLNLARRGISAIDGSVVVQEDAKANYVVTGVWSKKSAQEAQAYLDATVICDTKSSGYTSVPIIDSSLVSPQSSYTHFCANETVNGSDIGEDLARFGFPESNVSKNHVFVADISSNIASKPIDVSKFGVLYAGAQKNIGPAGVTIVIVRKDLINQDFVDPKCPISLNWSITAANDSLYNTPPVHAIYICGLVFEWALRAGGVAGLGDYNSLKAALLYNFLDASNGFYTTSVDTSIRSKMNVVFRVRGGAEVS